MNFSLERIAVQLDGPAKALVKVEKDYVPVESERNIIAPS
jgi:hypothetical protein